MRSIASHRLAGRLAALVVAGLATAVPATDSSAAPGSEAAAVDPVAAATPPDFDPGLTGRQIYEKVLDNRFESYVEELSMHSGDRGGNVQNTELEVKYRSFRNDSDRIVSKVIMKYHAPQDVRHLGYLVINKSDGSEDQFVYRPSSRRVQRINLRGEAIFGTDFAFEDIIPQEIEDASYERLPNSELDGRPVYAVRVIPTKAADSEYSKLEVSITPRTFVPLRVQYWDQDGLAVKQLDADADSITLYEHEQDGELKQVWLAKTQKIVHLRLESWTELRVARYDPKVDLRSRHFSERELTKGR